MGCIGKSAFAYGGIMKDYVIENAAAISSGGTKMTFGGAATAVFFGKYVNQVEVQLIGVVIGALVGIGGLIITAVAKYYERKDRIQVLLKSGDWDGIERRIDGNPKNDVQVYNKPNSSHFSRRKGNSQRR